MPHLIVLGDGIFKKGLEYEGGAFLNEISTLKKVAADRSLTT